MGISTLELEYSNGFVDVRAEATPTIPAGTEIYIHNRSRKKLELAESATPGRATVLLTRKEHSATSSATIGAGTDCFAKPMLDVGTVRISISYD